MRVRFLTLVVAALSFGFAPLFVHADDTKKDQEPAAKKDKGCEDGCDKCDKAEKKDGDCEGCGKASKDFPKRIECKDCDNSEKGPCEKCETALKDGKVYFVPVTGMSCAMCEGAVSAKLEKIDGIAKYAVNHRMGVAIFVEPGKTVKLSQIEEALGKGKFKIDETAKLAGKYTLQLEGVNAKDEKAASTICDIICGALGIDNCKNCSMCFDAKTSSFTLNATGKDLTLKTIKDKLAEYKYTIAGIEFHGPKAEDAKGKS